MKIKTSLFYSLAAATLMSGVANAQNSATDPVGFHTINVFGDSGNGPRFSLVSVGLVNPIEFAGGTTSITDTTITVDNTPFQGIDYGAVAADPGVAPAGRIGYNAYYVEVTSGAEAGAWANITANTDNTLTVDRDLSAAGAEKIAIRRHATIADLFGANNEAGLDGGDQALNADEVSLFAAGTSTVYFYADIPGFEGWYTSGLERADNAAIEPQQAVYVQRKVAGDLSFTRSGHVKVGPTKLNVNTGFNALANPRAVGRDDQLQGVFTLDTSNLFDANDLANSVIPGDQASNADEITVIEDNGMFSVYFRAEIPNVVSGWFDTNLNPAGDAVLENGKGFLLNHKVSLGAQPFVWTVPAEPIAE